MGFCAVVLGSIPAFGQFLPIAQPTAAYTSNTAVVAITPPDGAIVSSVSDGTQTFSFSPSLDAHTVPSGGWATWASPPETEGATPRVVGAYSAITTLTITLAVPSRTVGFEVEPDFPGSFPISADFRSGSTSVGTVSRSIDAIAGARLIAASSSTPITSVVLTIPSAANGIALAQLRSGNTFLGITTVPTLGTTATAGLGMMLLAMGALLARRPVPG